MSELQEETNVKMTSFRWTIVTTLFVATTINYLDRQVLSLTRDEFIKPEFHWNLYRWSLFSLYLQNS